MAVRATALARGVGRAERWGSRAFRGAIEVVLVAEWGGGRETETKSSALGRVRASHDRWRGRAEAFVYMGRFCGCDAWVFG